MLDHGKASVRASIYRASAWAAGSVQPNLYQDPISEAIQLNQLELAFRQNGYFDPHSPGQIRPSGSGTTYTWTGGAGSDWGNAGSWSPTSGPPGLGDTALDNSSTPMTIMEGQECATLTVDSSTALITISANFGATAEVSIEAGVVRLVPPSTGTITFVGSIDSPLIDVSAGATIASADTLTNLSYPIPQLIGTITDNGVIDIQSGTLDLDGGGALNAKITNNGTLELSNGGEISSSFTLSSNFLSTTGAVAAFAYGTLDIGITDTASFTSLSVSNYASLDIAAGDTLTISGPLVFGSLAGTFDFQGNLTGAGTLVTSGSSTLASSGTYSSDSLIMANGSVWYNTGTLIDYNSIGSGGSTSYGTLINATMGTIESLGSWTINVPVLNNGTMSIGDGTLTLEGGATLDGVTGGSGTLAVSSGNLGGTYTANASFLSSVGNLAIINSATLSVLASSTASLSLSLASADFELANGVDLTLASSASLTFGALGGTYTGYGTLLGTNPTIVAGTLTTLGTTTISGNGTLNVNGLCMQGTVTWVNGGVARVSGNIISAGVSNGIGTIVNNVGASFELETSYGLQSINDIFNNSGTIDVAGGTLELDAGGTLSGSLSGSGTLALSTGNVENDYYLSSSFFGTSSSSSSSTIATYNSSTAVVSGTFTGYADLSLSSGSILSFGSDSDASIKGTVTFGSLGGVWNGGASIQGTAGILTTKSVAIVASNGTLASTGLTIAGGDSWYSGGTTTVESSVAVGSGGGTIDVLNDSQFILSGSGTISATFQNKALGLVSENTGSAFTFAGTSQNIGTVTLEGSLIFESSITGTGTTEIGATGTLSLYDGAASTQLVDFSASGALVDLSDPSTFLGKFENFASGNTIDLVNTVATAKNYESNVLTLSNAGGTVVADLGFVGTYTTSSFVLATDGHGGTNVTFS